MIARSGPCEIPGNGLMTRRDGFLGGRVHAWQPQRGYRAGADAVMLAAACPAKPGQHVLELGCGAGVASLCLAARVEGLRLTALELQPTYAELARQNAAENGFDMQVMIGDLAAPPPELRAMSFDQVILNPPFFGPGTPAPETGRATARHENTPLSLWLQAAARRLKPGGQLTLIHRIERLPDCLAGLDQGMGALALLPIAARHGRPADRFVLRATKGSRTPMQLLSPFVMHASQSHLGDGADDFTEAARAVLREGAAISFQKRHDRGTDSRLTGDTNRTL